MSDMAQRLRQARKLNGFKSMKKATEAHGWAYSTYAGHENGWRDFPHEAPSYAKAYKVRIDWLLWGTGKPRTPGNVHPVVEIFEAIPVEKHTQALEFLRFLGQPKEPDGRDG